MGWRDEKHTVSMKKCIEENIYLEKNYNLFKNSNHDKKLKNMYINVKCI